MELWLDGVVVEWSCGWIESWLKNVAPDVAESVSGVQGLLRDILLVI